MSQNTILTHCTMGSYNRSGRRRNGYLQGREGGRGGDGVIQLIIKTPKKDYKVHFIDLCSLVYFQETCLWSTEEKLHIRYRINMHLNTIDG